MLEFFQWTIGTAAVCYAIVVLVALVKEYF
jgi:hypothetical protein